MIPCSRVRIFLKTGFFQSMPCIFYSQRSNAQTCCRLLRWQKVSLTLLIEPPELESTVHGTDMPLSLQGRACRVGARKRIRHSARKGHYI